MPLPLFPIGTAPTGVSVRERSKQRGVEIFIFLIFLFTKIENEDENECNPLLTIFLDMLILIGVDTIIAGYAEPCPPNANPQPCRPNNPCKQPRCPGWANPQIPKGDDDVARVMTICAEAEEIQPDTTEADEQGADEGAVTTVTSGPSLSPRKSFAPVQ